MTSDLLALQALQRGLEGWRLTIERSTRGKLSLALHPRGGLTWAGSCVEAARTTTARFVGTGVC